MTNHIRSKVIEYITEEVWRQGHDVNALDGIERVGWMTEAWAYALGQAASEDEEDRIPTVVDVLALGQMIEPHKNKNGLRKVHVRVGDRRGLPDPKHVKSLLTELMDEVDIRKRPLDFYFAFENIHPFVDGNGRTGKILLNWLRNADGSEPCAGLLNPIFPPNDFWGHLIRNP